MPRDGVERNRFVLEELGKKMLQNEFRDDRFSWDFLTRLSVRQRLDDDSFVIACDTKTRREAGKSNRYQSLAVVLVRLWLEFFFKISFKQF